mgnify:CR=1 FL=1
MKNVFIILLILVIIITGVVLVLSFIDEKRSNWYFNVTMQLVQIALILLILYSQYNIL